MPQLYAKTLANGQVMPLLLDEQTAQQQGLQPYYAPEDQKPDWTQPPDQYAAQLQSYAMPAPNQPAAEPIPNNGAGGSGGTGAATPSSTDQPSGWDKWNPLDPRNQPELYDQLTPEKKKQVKTDLLGATPDHPSGPKRTFEDLGTALSSARAQPQGQSSRLISPAHDQRVAYEISRPVGMGEGDLYEMDQANKAFDASSANVAQQKANYGLQQANQLERQNTELAWQVEKEKQKRATVDAEIERRRLDIDRRDAEAEKMGEATPAAFWKEKGPLGQIAASIAMALGGYLQGVQGRATNPGADLVSAALDDWIRGEKDKYQRAQGRVSEAKNAYAEALQRWGTPEAAEADLRARGNAAAEGLMKAQLLRSGASVQEASDHEAIKQRQAERAAAMAQLQAQMAGTIAEQYRWLPPQYSGGPAKNKDQKRMVRLPDGNWGYVRQETEMPKVQAKLSGNTGVLEALDDIDRLQDDNSMSFDDKKRAAEVIGTRVAAINNQMLGMGVMAEKEADRRMAELGSPEDWFNPTAKARRDATRRQIRREVLQTINDNVMADPEGTAPYLTKAPVQ